MSARGTGRVAVTGATGLVGAALVRHLAREGWDVLALARRPEAIPAQERVGTGVFDLSSPPGDLASTLRGCDAVVHAAWSTRERDAGVAWRADVEGSAALLEASRLGGVPRFVFVSSMSAHPEARSRYARAKLDVEARLDPSRDLVVRPGLVIARDAGLFARMAAFIRRFGVAPRFGDGRQPVQAIHVDDLCEGIASALSLGLTGTLTIADAEPVTLSEMFAMTGEALGRRVRFVPVPVAPLLALLRAAEALRVPLPVTSQNLLGLVGLRSLNCRADLALLRLVPRSAQRAIADAVGRG